MAAGGPGVWQARNSLEKKLILGLAVMALVCATLMLVIMAMTGQVLLTLKSIPPTKKNYSFYSIDQKTQASPCCLPGFEYGCIFR